MELIAHMPDLEKRLSTLGYKEKSKKWLTAWAVKAVEDEADEEEQPAPKPTRKRQNRIEEKEFKGR